MQTHTHTQKKARGLSQVSTLCPMQSGTSLAAPPSFIPGNKKKTFQGQKAAGFNERLQAMMQQVVSEGSAHKHKVCVN